VGKDRDRCGDSWKAWYLCFTSTPVFTVSLVLVIADEGSTNSEKLHFISFLQSD